MSDRHKGLLLVASAALLWSTGGIGIKTLGYAPLKVAFYRSAIAGVALLIYFRPRVWKWSPAFIAAIVSYAGCLTSFVVATKWTTAANAIFIQYSGVVWVLILSPFLLHEKMRNRDVIAVAVALAGMALFFVGKFDTKGVAGNLMGVVSSVFFAALVIALRRERDVGAESAVTWGNVLTAVAIFPFVARDLDLQFRPALTLTFLGLVQIALAYVLFVRGLKHVTATEASLTGMLEPVANPIWVALFYGERPGIYAIIGGVIVLAAIGWRTAGSSAAIEEKIAPPD